MTDIVNEKSTSYVTVSPKNKDGDSETPSTLVYQIDCITTGTPMLAETSLTPGTSVEITITPTQNAINDQSNSNEGRKVTVTAGYGANDQVIEVFNYRVKNLYAVT